MFSYFGYGSNLNSASLLAKGVEPLASRRAILHGWRLRFNVQHFFRQEGGVGNIERSEVPGDCVHGMLYGCPDEALAALDAMEAYGYGYDRINIEVEADDECVPVLTYIGMPEFINDDCLPSRRYLNIMIDGARRAGLNPDYVQQLELQPIHQPDDYPPFTPPPGDYPVFDLAALARQPMYTALCDAVFDMSEARPLHEYLKKFFGGRDMTMFHLKRLDNSAGNESMDIIRNGHLNETQRCYLNGYLNEYAREYRYVGRLDNKNI